MYGKKTLCFEEVAIKVIPKERRLKNKDNTSSNSKFVAIGRSYVKKNNGNVESLGMQDLRVLMGKKVRKRH